MGKLFANTVKSNGLSRVRIIWVIVLLAIILGFIILFGVFTPDDKLMINDEQNIKEYHQINDSHSIDQLMDKIKQINASHESKPNALSIIPLKPESMIVETPPIVSNSEIKPEQYTLESKKYSGKQINNQIRGSKSLMFSKYNGSASIIPQTINIKNGNSFESHVQLQINDDSVNSSLVLAKSSYELKAGSIIPSTMISGINSDLSGQVIAQVRDNIYNSISREYLLIPQGARLIGVYDSHITYGQQRLMVAWNRIIYPNGSSIKLGAMPGTDLEGYAGFFDEVDNKYWRIFGSSFIMGVITAGMQYSQNNTNTQNGPTGPSVGQTLSSSLGQQLGQTGLMLTQKNLNVQPTLIIKPGYLFNIMITADLTLPPYIKP